MITHVYEDILTWLNDVVRFYQNLQHPIDVVIDQPTFTNEISVFSSDCLDDIVKSPSYCFEGLNIRWAITKETFNQNLAKHKENNPFLYEIIKSFSWVFSANGSIQFPKVMHVLLEQISDNNI